MWHRKGSGESKSEVEEVEEKEGRRSVLGEGEKRGRGGFAPFWIRKETPGKFASAPVGRPEMSAVRQCGTVERGTTVGPTVEE